MVTNGKIVRGRKMPEVGNFPKSIIIIIQKVENWSEVETFSKDVNFSIGQTLWEGRKLIKMRTLFPMLEKNVRKKAVLGVRSE